MLAANSFSPKLAEVLKILLESGNYARNSDLKYCIFKELCNEMGFEFEILMYHANIRELLLNNVVEWCF